MENENEIQPFKGMKYCEKHMYYSEVKVGCEDCIKEKNILESMKGGNKSKMNELEQIDVVESTGGIDKSLYDGYRVPIEKIKCLYVQDTFPDGKNYDPNSTKFKWILRIWTKPLHVMKPIEGEAPNKTDDLVEFPKEDGSVDNWRVSLDLNFQNQKDDNGVEIIEKQKVEYEDKDSRGYKDGTVSEIDAPVKVISKAPKAILWKFMRKMGVADYRELKEKLALLTVKPATKDGDDRVFLNIVV